MKKLGNCANCAAERDRRQRVTGTYFVSDPRSYATEEELKNWRRFRKAQGFARNRRRLKARIAKQRRPRWKTIEKGKVYRCKRCGVERKVA